MARLPYPDLTQLPEEPRKVLEDLAPHNIYRMLAHGTAQIRPFIRLGSANFVELRLEPRLREIAILATARATGARYEWAHHVPIARACGVADELIEAIRRGEPARLDGVDADVAAFAREVTLDVRASDEALGRVRRALGDQQTVELLLVVGYYNMVARFLETSGVDIEPDFQQFDLGRD